MRDINEVLRIAYAAALSSNTAGVGVFYQGLPSNRTDDNYIIFRSINNVDASTKNTFETVTNITVEIHTKNNVGNRGLSADTIADEVLQLIYGSRQSNLALSRGQIYNTELANDVTQDFIQSGQFGYISRYLTFRHLIYCNGSNPVGGGAVLSLGAVLRFDYTGIGAEISVTDSSMQNKRIIDVNIDGVSYAEIITSGVPTGKQALYDSLTGTITWSQPLDPEVKVFVLYQLN